MKALEHLPSVETRDVKPRRVLFALLMVFVLMVTCVALAAAILHWAQPARPFSGQGETRLGIRLEVDPQAAEDRIEKQAGKRLTEAGWNDETQTSAHIPIDRAMELLAQQGWPEAAAGRSGHP
ncbi:hypothetical protein ABID08_005831 [Rhizobium binae]|uniref:Uncharacterized protein n=1 Tax=Rhizobium binae TaxID=1138190 RepID=A0ABV2MQL8_9HYPH|nr:hypothetical protein [Rhizobium binae]MBX4970037.1 hypothetical protein [Rhizobium binae]MBX4994920.1 hypothetical protein [Rhizobium binae]NKL52540.1 hypothetical protein [Rhizobium leguminosarum bv. viciae]QSY85008.1 hypothetical protein J2J99_25860 [Rhizobium binae]